MLNAHNTQIIVAIITSTATIVAALIALNVNNKSSGKTEAKPEPTLISPINPEDVSPNDPPVIKPEPEPVISTDKPIEPEPKTPVVVNPEPEPVKPKPGPIVTPEPTPTPVPTPTPEPNEPKQLATKTGTLRVNENESFAACSEPSLTLSHIQYGRNIATLKKVNGYFYDEHNKPMLNPALALNSPFTLNSGCQLTITKVEKTLASMKFTIETVEQL